MDIRTFKRKDDIVDIEVEAIDTAEVMEAPERLEKIVDYIIANHDRKTHSQEFTAMFCVSNVKSLVAYYELFRAKKEAGEHNLKVATIFSYQANEEDADADGMGTGDDMPDEGAPENKHSREKLDEYIRYVHRGLRPRRGTRRRQRQNGRCSSKTPAMNNGKSPRFL